MESLTRLVTESLARNGFDRPLDYRRLRWSRWFRCESHHSLLFVPSKPGVFALAEEVMDLASAPVATAASAVPQSEASGQIPRAGSREPEAGSPRRMLAVTQFFENDDMAFVLDRMLSRQNSISSRLASGRYFARFVVIEDETQRRSICSALNQWIISSTEKATGIGSHFASSLELTSATEYIPQANDSQPSLFEESSVEQPNLTRTPSPATADLFITRPLTAQPRVNPAPPHATTPQLRSGAAANIHCPPQFPSGF